VFVTAAFVTVFVTAAFVTVFVNRRVRKTGVFVSTWLPGR